MGSVIDRMLKMGHINLNIRLWDWADYLQLNYNIMRLSILRQMLYLTQVHFIKVPARAYLFINLFLSQFL
jgi:hypothetical protein